MDRFTHEDDYSESPERIIIDDDEVEEEIASRVSSVTSDSNYLINFSLKFLGHVKKVYNKNSHCRDRE